MNVEGALEEKSTRPGEKKAMSIREKWHTAPFELRLPVLFSPGVDNLLSSARRSVLKTLIGTSNCVPAEYLSA